MTKSEELIIRNTIERLRCEKRHGHHREARQVREALTGPAKLYVDTWIIGALECLLPETRDVSLGLSLSQ